MKTEIKTKWVDALRSGEYTKNRLLMKFKYKDQEMKYSALGVLAELMWSEKFADDGYGIFYIGEHPCTIPPELAETISLGKFLQTTIANMNDIDKMSFEAIADWIEENL